MCFLPVALSRQGVATKLARWGASDETIGGMVALPLAIQHRQSVFDTSEVPHFLLRLILALFHFWRIRGTARPLVFTKDIPNP